MPILNEHFTFDQAEPDHQRAFIGRPEKVLIPSLTKLYKWTNRPHHHTDDTNAPVTPWWSFVDRFRLPSGHQIEGYNTVLERAARVHQQRQHARRRPAVAAAEDVARSLRLAGNKLDPVQEYARARSAVSDRFSNNMERLWAVRLVNPVWGFAGRASAQPEFKGLDNVFLIGGADQLYVPNLTRSCVQELAFNRRGALEV